MQASEPPKAPAADSQAADEAEPWWENTSYTHASSCILPTTFVPLPLVGVREVNHDTKIFEFGLPAGQALDLPVCACLLLCAPGCEHESKGGGDAIRPYT